MSATKLIGIVLIVAGVLGLAYGGFTYTRHTSAADIGSLHVSVARREAVLLPVWAGIGVILLGGLVIAIDGRRTQ